MWCCTASDPRGPPLMAATAERPPSLPPPWLAVWRHALKRMQADGTWSPATRPLLDMYVTALMQAEEAREKGYAGSWDRAARRASMLADQLALTPRGRKAAGVRPAREADPFERFAAIDDLGVRRAGRRPKGGAA